MFKQYYGRNQTVIGFRKVWQLHCEHDMSFDEYVRDGANHNYEGYNINWYNF